MVSRFRITKDEAESQPKPKKKPLGLFLAFAIIAFGILGVYLVKKLGREESFPGLQVGHYVGLVENFPLGSASGPTTLYLERLPDVETLVLVMFAPGSSPISLQAVPAFPEEITSGRSLTAVPLKPLEFVYRDRSFRLIGSARENGVVEGSLFEGDQFVSDWSLQAVDLETLDERESLKADFSEEQIKHWLALKADLADVLSQIGEGERIVEKQEVSFQRLQSYLSEDGEERAKTVSKIEHLTQENQTQGQSIAKLRQETQKAWRELEVLNRITEEGKTVRLLRRLSRREDKWYDVNWRDKAGIDAQVASLIQSDKRISYRDFQRKLLKAREIQSINNQIKRERVRIAELTRPAKKPIAAEEAPASSKPEPAPRKKKSLWDRIF